MKINKSITIQNGVGRRRGDSPKRRKNQTLQRWLENNRELFSRVLREKAFNPRILYSIKSCL